MANKENTARVANVGMNGGGVHGLFVVLIIIKQLFHECLAHMALLILFKNTASTHANNVIYTYAVDMLEAGKLSLR